MLAVQVSVALVISSPLSVGHTGAEDRDTVLVNGSRNVVYTLIHIHSDGIGTCILIYILYILTVGRHTQDIACRGILQTLYSQPVRVVQGKVHRLVHPLLRGGLLQRYLGLPYTVCLVCHLRITGSIAHVTPYMHGNRQHLHRLAVGIHGNTCHTVLVPIKAYWCFLTGHHEGSVSYAG